MTLVAERNLSLSTPPSCTSSADAEKTGGRLKVCVVGSGTRFVSGISYYTYFLARALNERCEVAVILMRHLIPTRFYPGRRRVGHDVMSYDIAEELPTFDGVDWWGLPSVPRALSFLRSQRPDVLVLHWWTVSVLPWYLLLAWQAARRGSVVVLELHEDLDSGEASLPLVGGLARRGLKALCEKAAILVVHSAWDRDRMSASLGIPAEKFRVIPHGPYPILAEVDGEIAASRHSPAAGSSRAPSELTVLYFGTIRPYKGLEHLIEAFERVRDSGLTWTLLVVGETWEGWKLPIEMIEHSPHRESIELVNRYVTDEEVADFFGRADIVALPYLRSSASGPLAIAQALGLRVVVTAVGGLVEAVAGYSGGVSVKAGDPDELAAGLLTASALPSHGHATPVTWEAVAESYADAFAAIAPNAATARAPRAAAHNG